MIGVSQSKGWPDSLVVCPTPLKRELDKTSLMFFEVEYSYRKVPSLKQAGADGHFASDQ
jgi:hypothetical protein